MATNHPSPHDWHEWRRMRLTIANGLSYQGSDLGGVIYDAGTLTLSYVTLSGNKILDCCADAFGGGIYKRSIGLGSSYCSTFPTRTCPRPTCGFLSQAA